MLFLSLCSSCFEEVCECVFPSLALHRKRTSRWEGTVSDLVECTLCLEEWRRRADTFFIQLYFATLIGVGSKGKLR